MIQWPISTDLESTIGTAQPDTLLAQIYIIRQHLERLLSRRQNCRGPRRPITGDSTLPEATWAVHSIRWLVLQLVTIDKGLSNLCP